MFVGHVFTKMCWMEQLEKSCCARKVGNNVMGFFVMALMDDCVVSQIAQRFLAFARASFTEEDSFLPF